MIFSSKLILLRKMYIFFFTGMPQGLRNGLLSVPISNQTPYILANKLYSKLKSYTAPSYIINPLHQSSKLHSFNFGFHNFLHLSKLVQHSH